MICKNNSLVKIHFHASSSVILIELVAKYAISDWHFQEELSSRLHTRVINMLFEFNHIQDIQNALHINTV
jgi:hypothetical protein